MMNKKSQIKTAAEIRVEVFRRHCKRTNPIDFVYSSSSLFECALELPAAFANSECVRTI